MSRKKAAAGIPAVQKSSSPKFGVISCSFWRRKWQPTPVFLAGESLGQRGLVGCGLWGCKELDTTK